MTFRYFNSYLYRCARIGFLHDSEHVATSLINSYLNNSIIHHGHTVISGVQHQKTAYN